MSDEMAKTLVEIALQIRERVRDYIKTDKTFGEEIAYRSRDVTRKMDMFSEKALDEALISHGICARVVSEELGERIVPMNRKPECTLVFDPIDGSTNLVLGVPYYCVSIACSSKTRDVAFDDVEIGVVCDAGGKTYSAVKGKGAFLNGKRLMRRKISKHKPVMAIYTYGAGKVPRGIIELEKSVIVRIFGAMALDLCLVADGRFDAVIDTRDLISGYDILAGALILKEAGGQITDIKGNKLNKEVSASGFPLIATLDRKVHSEIVEKLKIRGYV